MSNTYYRYQGFVYGPIGKPKPVFNYEFPPDGPSDSMLESAVSDFDYESILWHEQLLSRPKYKWTGPPLEDWKEMIEGKDFHIVNKVENDLCPECGSDETRDDLDDTIEKGYRVCDKCLQEYYTSVRYSSHYCKEAIPITK